MPKEPKKENNSSKVVAIVIAIVAIACIPTGLIYGLQNAHMNSDAQKTIQEEQLKKQREIDAEITLNKKLIDENTKLGYSTTLKDSKPDQNFGKYTNEHWMANWKTNYGDLVIHLHAEDAPKTVENFVRLNTRNIYQNTIFHRMVKSDGMSVLQGGDWTQRDGQGGESAFFISANKVNNIPDELWLKQPIVDTQKSTATGGEFRNPKYYTKYDQKTGALTYPKGLMIMAKTSQVDSANSQFFITLTDTILPAQYTVFGRIDDKSFGTLDKIYKEIEPVKIELDPESGQNIQTKTDDGEPNKPIKIEKTDIMKM